MPVPPSSPATPWVDRAVIAGLSALILVGCLLAGRLTTGLIGAAAFWFGAGWVVGQVVKLHHGEAAAVAAADAAAQQQSLSPDLAGVLAELESARRDMATAIERRLRSRLTAGVAIGVALWLWSQFGKDPVGVPVLAINTVFGAVGGWIWAAGSRPEAYRRRYKDAVLPLLARSMGELSYRAAVPPDAAFLREQRMFAAFHRLSADDEIVGSYHGVPISIVELRLVNTAGKSDRMVFDGLFVRIALPRTLSGVTAVVADIGVLGALQEMLTARGGARVRVEDPDFERVYQVHATDQVSARALLTPAFMNRFLALGSRGDFLLPLAVAQGNELTVALPRQGGHDLFEPPRYTHAADGPAALARLRDDLVAVLTIADAVLDLDQSVRGRATPLGNERLL